MDAPSIQESVIYSAHVDAIFMTDIESASIANPAPLGLLAIGLSIILLSLGNLQLFATSDGVVMSMAFFVGGIALLAAGLFEFKKGNTFNATVFVAFSMFWISFVAINRGMFGAPTADSVGVFCILWGVVALFFFVGALKMPRVLQIIFLTLTVTLFAIGAANFLPDMAETILYVAGAAGMVTGLVSIYTAFAMVVNEAHGNNVLPLR